MRKIQLIIVPLLSLAILSCNGNETLPDASGVFDATEIMISAEISGKVTDSKVDEGSLVKQGELLLSLDSTQLSLKVKQLESSLRAIRNRLPDITKQKAALEEQLATAKREQKRVSELLKANAVSAKQMDDVNAQVAVLDDQLAALKSNLNSSYASVSAEAEAMNLQLGQLKDQLTKCTVRSPQNGVVLNKYIEMGEVAMPGKALLKVADLDKIYLKAYITGDQLTKVKLGQNVKVFSDAGNGDMKEYTGVINWISSNAEFTPKTIQSKDERANLVYAVKVTVKNDGYLKIGMYGEIKF